MPELITLGETMVLFTPTEAGFLRYIKDYRMHIAGAESNLAIGLSKLGHTTGWISKVGDDEFGAYIKKEISGEGVDTSQVIIDSKNCTGIMFKQIVTNEETEVLYYRKDSAASTLLPKDINEKYLEDCKIIHITGITPALSIECRKTIEYVVDFAKEKGILVSFDPNIRLKLWSKSEARDTLLPLLKKSDIVMLGESEAEILLGKKDVNEIISFLREYGVSKIAIKLGENGSIVADTNNIFKCSPYPAKCIDPIGAGDAFNSGFLCGILENRPLEICGKMGNIMGSFAVSIKGDIEGFRSRKHLDIAMGKGEHLYR